MNGVTIASFADELSKIAAEEKKLPHPAAIVGGSLAGLGAGYGAGHLATHGLNKLLKTRESGKGIPRGVMKYAPAAAGLAGLGVGAHQAYTWDKARKSLEQRNKGDGSQDS
jgi:F0F1-type ATP synthase membrane subunit c/vacuolar-type H+-ATPase subunit K